MDWPFSEEATVNMVCSLMKRNHICILHPLMLVPRSDVIVTLDISCHCFELLFCSTCESSLVSRLLRAPSSSIRHLTSAKRTRTACTIPFRMITMVALLRALRPVSTRLVETSPTSSATPGILDLAFFSWLGWALIYHSISYKGYFCDLSLSCRGLPLAFCPYCKIKFLNSLRRTYAWAVTDHIQPW